MYTLQSLKEVWRVLKTNAILCDIHPYNAFVPVEIVSKDQRTNFATLDRRHAIEGINIAQNTLAIMCHEDYFHLEQEESFITYRYWNTIEDVAEWYSDTQIKLSEEFIEQARAMLKVRSKDAQIAVQRIFLIGRYRKLETKLIQIE